MTILHRGHGLAAPACLPLILLLAATFAPTPADATARALLVAVSGYPDAKMRLEGPANDSRLLYEVLTQRGFDRANISVLADGIGADDPDGIEVAGQPTRQAIVDAFGRLAAESGSGDEVFIAMSGHGTQQPAHDLRSEPDGLDELFLPIDVGRWDASIDSIDNAIVDDEIGQFLDRIRRTGASVWLVLDSCHSGTGTRAAEAQDVRRRAVSPESLGVPAARMQTAAAAEAPAQAADLGADTGLVAFFAAQSDESALELALPAKQPGAQPHGLLSYYIAQALARGRPGSYLDLAQSVRAGYDEVGGARRGFPTPLFEGDLAAPILGGTADGPTHWPARLLDAGRARVDAGQVHGLAVGAEVLLRDISGAPVARGNVATLGLAQSDVALTWTSGPTLPAALVAEAVTLPALAPYLVDVPPDPPAALQAALTMVRARDAVEAGITFATGVPTAELRLQVARDAAWLVPHGDTVTDIMAGGGAGLGLNLPAAELADQLGAALRARAATYRLAQLSETFAGTPAARALRVELTLLPRTGEPTAADPHPACAQPAAEAADTGSPVGPGEVPRLRNCDTLFVSLRNRSNDPLDVGLFYVDSLGAAVALPGMTALRLDAGAPPLVLPLTVTTWDPSADRPTPTGNERLVVTGLKRVDKGDRSFTLDFAKPLGLEPRTGPPAGPDHPFLDLLAADQAAPTRGAPKADPRADAFITSIHWQTLPQ